jgi:hypothetical protein
MARLAGLMSAPILQYEAFDALRGQSEFVKVVNGGYCVEWDRETFCQWRNKADLSNLPSWNYEVRISTWSTNWRRSKFLQKTRLDSTPSIGVHQLKHYRCFWMS